MVDAANRELKDQIDVVAYIYGGAKTLLDQKTFHCDITIDGQIYPDTMKMTGITVANVAPPTSVSDGDGHSRT
jgi:diacylglycerol kinase family enzyme